MTRRLPTLCFLVLTFCVQGGTRIQATGNLETLSNGVPIQNRLWDTALLPIVWTFNDPATVGTCSYTSTTAPANTLQAAIAAGFGTWQNDPDSTMTFTYGGTTAVTDPGADGTNALLFCSSTVFSTGTLARTVSTALTVPLTVIPDGGCPAGQGLMTSGANSWCVPVGTYAAGTIIDADIDFNTRAPLTAEANLSTGDPNSATIAGKFDVQAIATHEQGHFIGLSHDPVFNAAMFTFTDNNPFSDGQGQRVPRTADLATAGRYYPEATHDLSYGSITGFVTLDGLAADGVHVVAIDPATMIGVAGRFSLSAHEDPDTLGIEGPDFAANGQGFYRIDGLPPGNYYVYAEYFDASEPFTGRLANRYNTTVGRSNVSNGNPGSAGQGADWLGFIPQLAEFHDAGESGNGGDGVNAGTALDNSDRAALVPVVAGQVTAGIDIAINIEPVSGQTPSQRQNPTSRTVVVNDLQQGTDITTGFFLNGGNDDFYAIRYPAASLPAPPYNVAEGLWAREGRNDLPYTVSLTYGDPLDSTKPALNDPIVASAGRVLSGGPDGMTDTGEIVDIRDQWNVTINQSRDVWVVMNQPPSPAGATLLTQGYIILVARTTANAGRVKRTRLTQNGGATWSALTADPFYDLILETTPPVTITNAGPATGVEGATLDVTVTGAGFVDGSAVQFGGNISVNAVTFLGPTQLLANITIACTGATSDQPINVKVTNPGVVFPNVSSIFTITPALGDTDCDGVTDVSDCAPNDATLKYPATEVLNDIVTRTGLTTTYSWESQETLNGTATEYDVVTGLISGLRAAGNYSTAVCSVSGLPEASYTDLDSDPAPHEIRYWLVRARNACNVGRGTFGDSSLSPDPRDALDAGAPCP